MRATVTLLSSRGFCFGSHSVEKGYSLHAQLGVQRAIGVFLSTAETAFICAATFFMDFQTRFRRRTSRHPDYADAPTARTASPRRSAFRCSPTPEPRRRAKPKMKPRTPEIAEAGRRPRRSAATNAGDADRSPRRLRLRAIAAFATADEERAHATAKEALLGGRDGVARAVEMLPKLPWIVGVKAVAPAWPEMKPAFRKRLLAGLARMDTEAARRVRLSLARGLFKLDVPGRAEARGRAWQRKSATRKPARFRQATRRFSPMSSSAAPSRGSRKLPLAELKPAETDLLVHARSSRFSPCRTRRSRSSAFSSGRTAR